MNPLKKVSEKVNFFPRYLGGFHLLLKAVCSTPHSEDFYSLILTLSEKFVKLNWKGLVGKV